MQVYKYEARIPVTGKLVKGNVEADSEKSAAEVIKRQGQVPIEITLSGKSRFALGGHVKTKDKVLFSRQLSTLINAGLPLLQSLRQVSAQTTNKNLKSVIEEVTSKVEGGKSFSDSLLNYPKIFDRIFTSLVAAGEVSGNLDQTLERLANQQEKDADIISKVRGAMVYPGIVLLVMLGVVIFMVVKVLPAVQNIYSTMPGTNLPFVTVALLAVSSFIINYWWIAIIVLIGLVFGFKTFIKSDTGRKFVDLYKLRGWPIKGMFNKMYMARFARTAQSLSASGVPLLQVIDVSSDSVNNVHIKKSLENASVKIKGGKSLSQALDGDPNFLTLVPNMISIGEESGALEVMLGKVADYYEKEVDNEVKAVSTIIEPVLMIVMGGIAIVIVTAILLPIYGLVTKSGFSAGSILHNSIAFLLGGL